MSRLLEVRLEETTMRRTVAVSVRAEGYMPLGAKAMIELLKENGSRFFSKE